MPLHIQARGGGALNLLVERAVGRRPEPARHGVWGCASGRSFEGGVCQSAMCCGITCSLCCGITCSLYCCAGGLVCGRAGGAAAAVFGGQVAVSCELWDPGCCSCSDVITPERSLDTGICMHHRAPRATATATAFLLRHTLSTHASPHAPAVRYPPQQTPNWSSCRRRRSPEHLRLSNTFTFTFPPIGPPPPAATSWCTRIRNPSRHAHASHTRWPSASYNDMRELLGR